jgi:uncharacterized membrane protein YebE (DUF533 family)
MSKQRTLFEQAWSSGGRPNQNKKAALIVAAIGTKLLSQKKAFNLDEVTRPIGGTAKDIQLATQVYYDRLLRKHWTKGIPDERRRKSLAFVAEKLRLDPRSVAQSNEAAAATFFGASLAEVLADGVVTDEEIHRLSQVSDVVGKRPHEFLREHLLSEGADLFRGVFAEATATGVLEQRLWEHLVESARKLGVTQPELKSAVSPLARSFAEHVLADTKSDGKLTGKEEAYLEWLIASFDFGDEHAAYVRREIDSLKERSHIAAGNLTEVSVPAGVSLQPGETAYSCGPGTLRLVQPSRPGSPRDAHSGQVILTDRRLLFLSPTKPAAIPYRSIVGWRAVGSRITISVAHKPEIHLDVAEGDGLAGEKLVALLRRAGRGTPGKTSGDLGRLIPGDVRGRVWRRYGGKCGHCGSGKCLEFAELVPRANWGDVSPQNVQLLCRECLAKNVHAT